MMNTTGMHSCKTATNQEAAARHLLVIDDDALFCDAISNAGLENDFTIHTAHSASAGLALCHEFKMDVVLLDQHLPDKNGSDICLAILSCNDRTKIILATAYPDLGNAVEVIKLGAFDYLAKPFNIDELCFAINRAFKALELEQLAEVSSWKNRQEAEKAEFIGSSKAAQAVRSAAAIAATSRAPVLLTGSTGTGKTLLARCIHSRSDLADKVFLSINCAVLPESLIEAELFGTEKGAYTDAGNSRRGIFEMAEGGTLFLDEIGTLPLQLQAKLLGVLDDGMIKRLGGERSLKVNVRIITATNANLVKLVQQGQFREDLFYRLSVLTIELPALTQRKKDIPELCNHFLRGSRTGKICSEELDALAAYHWPGNIRELRNIMERASLLANKNGIFPSQFLRSSQAPTVPVVDTKPAPSDHASLKEMEKKHILSILHSTNFNRSRTARILDISRSTLIRKMKVYELEQSDSGLSC